LVERDHAFGKFGIAANQRLHRVFQFFVYKIAHFGDHAR